MCQWFFERAEFEAWYENITDVLVMYW